MARVPTASQSFQGLQRQATEHRLLGDRRVDGHRHHWEHDRQDVPGRPGERVTAEGRDQEHEPQPIPAPSSASRLAPALATHRERYERDLCRRITSE